MKRILIAVVCILFCEGIGLLATPITIHAIPTWYATLNKPFFSPPNWVFGPVWTMLYLFMGLSAFLVWEKGIQKKKVMQALSIFALQLFLNFYWSFAFFGGRNIVWGFAVIVMLLLAIIATIKLFYPLSKTASYLLYPYLAWVSFATLLNTSLLFLNR